MAKRAALYLRVSTDEQTTDNQRVQLRELAERRGLEVVAELSETESGGKRSRRELDNLLEMARAGRFDCVLVTAVDRLTRAGALPALLLVHELSLAGVAVISARESWLDSTSDSPFRSSLIALAGDVAKLERDMISERTKAGIKRRRKKKPRWGRPPASVVDLSYAAGLHAQGLSVRKAAKRAGIGATTLREHLERLAARKSDERQPPRG